MQHKITAHYRIVTPMFIGDANQQATGISPNSVKGALRFWWRALNWGKFRENTNDIDALRTMHTEEARLFGSVANNDGGGGQGCFLLRVAHDSPQHTDKPAIHPKFKDYAAARYLGYGLMVAFGRNDGATHSGQLERGCLNEGQEFTVELLFKGSIELSVQNALITWGLLGGLGSRSRHGMGCVALKSLKVNGVEKWVAPTTEQSYRQQIKELFSDTAILSTDEPPFSAFSGDSRIDQLLTANDCYTVLDNFGKAMLMYRSWGRNGMVLGQPSEKRFQNDHDWYRDPNFVITHPNFHPERVVFGLPHNYHQNHHHIISEKHERRSSPLLFHVHPVGTRFVGISVYLPAQFLPSGEQIEANGRTVPAQIDWTVITNFIDGKVGNPPTATARFPSKMAVLP